MKMFFMSVPVSVLVRVKPSSQSLILWWISGVAMMMVGTVTAGSRYEFRWRNWTVRTVPLVVSGYSPSSGPAFVTL